MHLSGVSSAQEPDGRIEPTISKVGPGGLRTYLADQWGMLFLNFDNPRDESVELLATTYFDEQKTLQFGRRVSIPPRSRLRTWHPIHLPAAVANDAKSFNFHTLLMQTHQEREVLIRSDSGQLQIDGSLERTRDQPLVGIISEPIASVDAETDWLFELTKAARPKAFAARRIVSLRDQHLPPGTESLQAFDHLIVADDRISQDQAEMAAMRRWLYSGGHLWVMLDRVDARTLELLLGDEFRGAILDRIGLPTVHLDAGPAGIPMEKLTREFDDPVDFVRLLLPDANAGDVAYVVDGWPAAIWKNCGDGRLLVTTLGPQAWMRLPTPADKVPATNERDFIPLEPLSILASGFFEPRPATLLEKSALEPQVQEYIGYSIPSRWLVTSLLIGLIALLAGSGWWLWQKGRLELLGAIGPGLAVATSVSLVLIGRHQRQGVPPSVAAVQFVQIIPGTDDVRVEGIAGLFSPEPGTASIRATRGGWLLPDMSGQEGQTRRMVWTDLDDWRWENLPQPAGLRVAPFAEAGAVGNRTEVRATFGPRGLIGSLQTSQGAKPSDAVLATRDGRIGVDLNPDGTFTARADNVFAPKQFVDAELLSDEQNRRRGMLEQLLVNSRRPDYPDLPQLLFWTDPWDVGFRFGDDHRSFGTALVATPIQWDRPPTGTEISLPSPLLPYRGTAGPDGTIPSGLYNHRRREWVQKSIPSFTWLRFQIPPVLLPVEIQQGRITVQVTGPIGRLEIAGRRDAQAVPIQTWIDPVGALSSELRETELLPVAADGGVLLRVSGGDPDRPELTETQDESAVKAHFWRIESLILDLKLKTLAPPGLADKPVTGG